jgi:hypothetical protein
MDYRTKRPIAKWRSSLAIKRKVVGRSTLLRSVAALALLHALSPTLAGPPLSIDDPGILDPLQLEAIVATTLVSTDAGDYYQVPVLDISLGFIQDYAQVSLVYPFVYSASNDGGSASDFGNLELGVKWRFLNSTRLQLAFAPYYAFGVPGSTAEKGIGDDTDVVFFPVNAEYQINEKWRLNGEVRYASVDGGDNNWGYGAAMAYARDQRWELLFELSGATGTDFDNGSLEARVGFDAGVTETFHILFSMGTGLSEPSGEDKLDYDVFLGFQFFR